MFSLSLCPFVKLSKYSSYKELKTELEINLIKKYLMRKAGRKELVSIKYT